MDARTRRCAIAPQQVRPIGLKLAAVTCGIIAALLLWAAQTGNAALTVPPVIAYAGAWVFGVAAIRLVDLAVRPSSPGDGFAVLLASGLALIGGWIAVGPGSRLCTRGTAGAAAEQLSGAACRIPFGIGALATLLIAGYAASRWVQRSNAPGLVGQDVLSAESAFSRVSPRAVRDLFPGAATHATIDGNPVTLESVSVRSHNRGQHWRTPDVVPVSYSVELPRAYVVALLAEPDMLPGLIEDAQQYPDDDDALATALRAAGFPDADEAMNDPRIAPELVRFYVQEALVRWLGDGAPEREPGFVLNSVERLEVRPAGVLVEGQGRRSDIAVVYQDV